MQEIVPKEIAQRAIAQITWIAQVSVGHINALSIPGFFHGIGMDPHPNRIGKIAPQAKIMVSLEVIDGMSILHQLLESLKHGSKSAHQMSVGSWPNIEKVSQDEHSIELRCDLLQEADDQFGLYAVTVTQMDVGEENRVHLKLLVTRK